MEDEGQAETKWSPIDDTKPLLKHVRPIRANYVPRKYKPFEDGDTFSDLCACSNTNSSITLQNIGETPRKYEHEKKPNQSEEKLLINKSPLKGKDVAASIHISVEPVACLSPLRIARKNIIEDIKHSPEISANKTKAIRFNTNGNDSFTHIVIDVEKAKICSEDMDNGEISKRPRGRPKGSTKRQYPRKQRPRKQSLRKQCNNRAVLVSRRTCRTKPLKSCESPNTTPLSGSPRKRIKLTLSQGKKHAKESIEDQGPSSDAPTNEATANDNANTTHQCNICNKHFSTQGRLENHMHWHVKRRMFKCRVCKRIFKGFGHFIRHQQLHCKAKVEKPIVKSPQSGANNNPKTICKTKVEKTHKCNICSQTFTHVGRLKLHLATHASPKKYRCHVCSKEFVNFGWLKHHAQNSHDLTHLSRRETRIRGSTSCVRKKLSNTLPELQAHEQVVNNLGKTSRASKPIRVCSKSDCNSPDVVNRKTGEYQCGLCNKVFMRQQTLVEHKRIHSGEMPYECHICNKRIMWRYQLYHHCKTVHGETRTYKCDECGALFTTSKLLRGHKDTHCQAKPEPHLMSNPKSEDLQDNEENVYKCDKCNRSFRSLHGLHRHSASHRYPHPPPQIPPRRQSSRLRASRSPPKPQDPSPTPQDPSPTPQDPSPTPQDPFPTPQDRTSSKYATRSQIFSHASESHKEKAPQNKKQPTPKIEPDKQEWIKFTRENGQQVYRCGLCKNSDRKFSLVASVRKHVGMVHRDYTDNLVEPPGLYDDLPEETSSESKNSTSTPSLSTSGGGNPTSQSSNLQKNCTCNGRGRAFVYKNNKLTHLPSNCPVHNKESSEPKKAPKGTQILKCKHCEEEFDGLEREKFQEHELSHELKETEQTSMAYACFECEVEFAMANELMDHYENEH